MSLLLAAWMNDQDLRHIAVDAALGRPVEARSIEGMATVLEELIEEAARAKEPSGTAADLVGIIDRLAKERATLETDAAETEKALEEKIAELEADHKKVVDVERTKRLELEKETDDLKAKIAALEAERSKVIPIGAGRKGSRPQDEKRISELEDAVDHERAKRVDAETKCRNLEDENARLKDAAERSLDWTRRRTDAEIEERTAAHRDRTVEETKARAKAEAELNVIRLELRAIAIGAAGDAHRRVRVLVGQEIIDGTGTGARPGYIPTRSERKKNRRVDG